VTLDPAPPALLDRALIAYGLALFRQAVGAPPDPADAALALWAAYTAVVAGAPDPVVPALPALAAPFAFLQLPPLAGNASPDPALTYYQPGLLRPHAAEPGPGALYAQPVAALPAAATLQAQAQAAYHGFVAAWTQAQSGAPADGAALGRFLECYRAWAWAVPAPGPRPAVALYQFYKTVVALAYCAVPAGTAPALLPPAAPPPAALLLIAGDIPGIQGTIYTVAAAAAAKGLRGRSAYVQLLADAVVRRVRALLGLPAANLVYAGGGKFLLLAPATAAPAVEQLAAALDDWLLAEFQGDLSVVLVTHALPAADLGTPACAAHLQAVQTALQQARYRRFPGLPASEEGYAKLFGPQAHPVEASARGCCLVCQKPLTAGNQSGEPPRDSDPPGRLRCRQCVRFEYLARHLGRATVATIAPISPNAAQPSVAASYFDIADIRYDFDPPAHVSPDEVRLAVNQPAFWESGADGFWLIANTTPYVQDSDVKDYDRRHRPPPDPSRPGQFLPDPERPKIDDVKDFRQLAEQALGVPRVGVLRMDVDNLGLLLGEGFRRYDTAGHALPPGPSDPALTLPALATLSGGLSLFFEARVPALCAALSAADPDGHTRAGGSLYIIYSGGDDLFVVGGWDRIAVLADRVRTEFGRYTGGNPALGLSAAVTLEGAKFPLYRAAERAKAAEDAAKAYTRADGRRKDAVSLLGQTVGWDEFAPVRAWQDRFYRWIYVERHPEDALPSAAEKEAAPQQKLSRAARPLLQLILQIYALHEQTRQAAYAQHRRKLRAHQTAGGLPPNAPVFVRHRVAYGRWMWMLQYSLARFVERVPPGPIRAEIREAVQGLQGDCLRPGLIDRVGLAARWAELLLRSKEDRA